jgi:hypothetical protein
MSRNIFVLSTFVCYNSLSSIQETNTIITAPLHYRMPLLVVAGMQGDLPITTLKNPESTTT